MTPELPLNLLERIERIEAGDCPYVELTCVIDGRERRAVATRQADGLWSQFNSTYWPRPLSEVTSSLAPFGIPVTVRPLVYEDSQ